MNRLYQQAVVEDQVRLYLSGSDWSPPTDNLLGKASEAILSVIGHMSVDVDSILLALDCLKCRRCDGTGMKADIPGIDDEGDCELCRGLGVSV